MAHHLSELHRGIAQLVEQRSPKPRAEGSSPSAPAKNTGLGHNSLKEKASRSTKKVVQTARFSGIIVVDETTKNRK